MYPADDLHLRLVILTEQVREITGRMNEQVQKNQRLLHGDPVIQAPARGSPPGSGG